MTTRERVQQERDAIFYESLRIRQRVPIATIIANREEQLDTLRNLAFYDHIVAVLDKILKESDS